MNSQFLITEVDNKIYEFESAIIQEATTIMQSEGYVKFYYDVSDYVFEDASGDKHQIPEEMDQSLDRFNAILGREKMEINL